MYRSEADVSDENISAYFVRFPWIPTMRLLPVVTQHDKGFLKHGGGVRRMCCPCG